MCIGSDSISIHALAKRATSLAQPPAVYANHFNPRPRKEGDPVLVTVALSLLISIHALAKRATKHGNTACDRKAISIHALAKRATKHGNTACDRKAISIHALAKRATGSEAVYKLYVSFQSTPSQRGRRGISAPTILYKDFNPRPRKEGDAGR